jgi:hypothetical protein
MSNQPYSIPFEAQFDPERAQEYTILSLLQSTINTCELVRVQDVQPQNDRVGFVTVQPLVLDASTGDIVLAQTPAYNVPYLRLQGGVSAIELDPAVGDIGLAVYAQRDITTLKATLQEGPAPTARAFSTADGLYFGGFLNAAPTQYIRFLAAAAGIVIHSPGSIALTAGTTLALNAGTTLALMAGTEIDVTAPTMNLNTNVNLSGTFNSTNTGVGSAVFANRIVAPDVVLPAGNVNTHIHGGVQPGTGNTHSMNT